MPGIYLKSKDQAFRRTDCQARLMNLSIAGFDCSTTEVAIWPFEGFGDHFDPAATVTSQIIISSAFQTNQRRLSTTTDGFGSTWTTDENYQPYWSNGFTLLSVPSTYSTATTVPSWVTTGIGAPTYTTYPPPTLISSTDSGGGTTMVTNVSLYKYSQFGLPDIFVTMTATVQLLNSLTRTTQNNLGLTALRAQPFDPLPVTSAFVQAITWPDTPTTTQRIAPSAGAYPLQFGASSNCMGTPPAGFVPVIFAIKSKVRISTASLTPELWATLLDGSFTTQTPLDLGVALPIPGTYIFTPYTTPEEGHIGSDIPPVGGSIPYLPPYADTNYGVITVFGGPTGPF